MYHERRSGANLGLDTPVLNEESIPGAVEGLAEHFTASRYFCGTPGEIFVCSFDTAASTVRYMQPDHGGLALLAAVTSARQIRGDHAAELHCFLQKGVASQPGPTHSILLRSSC